MNTNRFETMRALLCHLIEDIKEKIQEGDKYFNKDIEEAIVASKRDIDEFYYGYLSNHYGFKGEVASLRMKLGAAHNLINVSSLLHKASTVLSEVCINNTRVSVLITRNNIKV